MRAGFGAGTAHHGRAIGALAPDLVTLAIGINDGNAARVGTDVGTILAEIRAARPEVRHRTVPIAVLRPERSCSFPHFGRLPTPP